MTANQINYQNMVEAQRSNRARESETERHNRRTEGQTDRSLDLTELHNSKQQELWSQQGKESKARTFGIWVDNVFKPAEKVSNMVSQGAQAAGNLLKGFSLFK